MKSANAENENPHWNLQMVRTNTHALESVNTENQNRRMESANDENENRRMESANGKNENRRLESASGENEPLNRVSE